MTKQPVKRQIKMQCAKCEGEVILEGRWRHRNQATDRDHRPVNPQPVIPTV